MQNLELTNAAVFTNYMLKLECDLTAENDACCIFSASKGGFCVLDNNAKGEILASDDHVNGVVANTATFTKAEFEAWDTGSREAVEASDATIINNNSVNDPFFQFFYCGGSRDHNFSCYKYQRSSSTEKDGDPRFDTDGGAEFFIINSGSRSSQTVTTLTGALDGFSTTALTLVAAILTLSFN